MKFETKPQQDCYNKIAGWMDELFSDYPWEKLDDVGFGLFMGSAWVEVKINPWNDDDSVINTRSKVVINPELNLDLLQFLLEENAERLFGAFSLSKAGEILFEHTIVGSTCDPEELESSVIAVLETADDYDDQIIKKWGGQRALDISP
ncbi:MAG: YbjN domain-containing protein [Microcoleaceae cyanobacterium]